MKHVFIALLLLGFNIVNAEGCDKSVLTNSYDYSSLAIVTPSDKATIRNNQGAIDVEVEVEPDLCPGDKFYMLLDGSVLGAAQSNLFFHLTGIDRGAHTLAIQIVGTSGAVKKISPSIEVYVFRPRINMRSRH